MSVAHFYLTLIVLNFQKLVWFGGAFPAQSSFFCFRVVFRNMAACALKFPGSVPLPNLNRHFLLHSWLLSLSYSVLNPLPVVCTQCATSPGKEPWFFLGFTAGCHLARGDWAHFFPTSYSCPQLTVGHDGSTLRIRKSENPTSCIFKHLPTHHWIHCSSSWNLTLKLGIGACSYGQNYSHFKLLLHNLSACFPVVSLCLLWDSFVLSILKQAFVDLCFLPHRYYRKFYDCWFILIHMYFGVIWTHYHLILLQMFTRYWLPSFCVYVEIQRFKNYASTIFPESTSWMTSQVHSSFEIDWVQIIENYFVKQSVVPRAVSDLPWDPQRSLGCEAWSPAHRSQLKLLEKILPLSCQPSGVL